MLLTQCDTYEEIYANTSLEVPEYYNIATDVCDRHTDRKTPALVFDMDGENEVYSFKQLQAAANGFANVLGDLKIDVADRIAIVAQPCFAIPVAHIGAWKAGVVTCPIATLFAEEALIYRFTTSGAKLVVTDEENEEKVRAAAAKSPSVRHILVFGREGRDVGTYWQRVNAASSDYETRQTKASDPAFLNYTSGTTGLPKAVLATHAHMIGQGAAIEFLYHFPKPGDVMWSPADWAWLAGQMCTLMAGMFLGMTVVARPRAGFDPADAYRVLAEHKVTHTLLIPTMMKHMRQVAVADQRRGQLSVQVVGTGGEPCGPELYRWCREVFDAPLNETFGQTECATMIINNQMVMDAPHGCLGKPAPGLYAAIIDADGNETAPDEIGEIAARTPHPIIFKEYLNNPTATAEKFDGNWMRTGDLGWRDANGFFWYSGRADDVITSSGYRIGPGEVENALLSHPAVALAAVIGLPDPNRTEIVAAYITLTDDCAPSDQLAEEIRGYVRDTLARHEVPRKVVFVDTLPTTTTGKLMRKALKQSVLDGDVPGL